jgi:hypothetical protein
MVSFAMVLAASLVHGACSAEQRIVNSTPVGDEDVLRNRLDGPYREASQDRSEPAMTRQRIVISSDWGQVTAEFVDNETTMGLMGQLPLTLEMRDHLRQEKTGTLPSPLPESPRQTGFAAGTLGLWGSDDFVIYYRNGSVPRPGIIVLGRVAGDVSIFDRPGPVTIQVESKTEAVAQRSAGH